MATPSEMQKMGSVLRRLDPNYGPRGDFRIMGLQITFLETWSKGWFINDIEFALPNKIGVPQVRAAIRRVANLKKLGMLVH